LAAFELRERYFALRAAPTQAVFKGFVKFFLRHASDTFGTVCKILTLQKLNICYTVFQARGCARK
jgi:hypothetical protein